MCIYPSVYSPRAGPEDIERVKDSVEVWGLLQERVVLVDVCHTTHDGDWGEKEMEGREG